MMNQESVNKLFARGEGILMEARIRQQALDRGYSSSGTVEEVLQRYVEPLSEAMNIRANYIKCPPEAAPYLWNNSSLANYWLDNRAGGYIHPGHIGCRGMAIDELVGICNQWLKRQDIAQTGAAEIRTDKWGMTLALLDHHIKIANGKVALIRQPGKTRQALEYRSAPGTHGNW